MDFVAWLVFWYQVGNTDLKTVITSLESRVDDKLDRPLIAKLCVRSLDQRLLKKFLYLYKHKLIWQSELNGLLLIINSDYTTFRQKRHDFFRIVMSSNCIDHLLSHRAEMIDGWLVV